MTDKKAVDLSSADPILAKRLQKVDEEQSVFARGIGGDPLNEPVPQYIKTNSEKIIENGHNVSIVLGRDRPGSRLSGYGGIGHTGAGSLDIVVGRLGHKAKDFIAQGKRFWVDPDFKQDAARIYISQKTDIDENFDLANGKIGIAKTRSGIGLKADGIRIIGREGIKLVTGTDAQNSMGADIQSTLGVDIIAGNDDSDLQPMVKGNNLRNALKRIVFHLDKLNGIVDSMLMAQMTFNGALTHHFHFSPFFGLPTTPSPPVVASGIKTMMDHLLQAKRSLITHKINLTMFKISYLNPVGKKYILSRFNNSN